MKMNRRAPVLELKNVTVIKGDENKKVLKSFSLTIPAGENVSILGPNGAGKSSLIKTITREYYPVIRRGSLFRIWGEAQWDLFELRDLLGIVTNDLQSVYHREITAMETILSGFFGSIGLHKQRITAGMKKKALDVLKFLEIVPLKDRTMSVMSSGEARRFLIGRAIVHDPKALILDEPTNSLDLRTTLHFKKIMRKIARAGTSIILVTQNLQDIIPEITRVVFMKQGRILRDGAKEDVLTQRHVRDLFEIPVELRKKDGYYYTLG